MEGIVYMAGADPSTQAGKVDMSQAATLNRVLTKLYPREVPVTAQALLMVLHDDQVGLGRWCCSWLRLQCHAWVFVGPFEAQQQPQQLQESRQGDATACMQGLVPHGRAIAAGQHGLSLL